MQVKVTMSDKEKKIAMIVAVVAVFILYYLNKLYMYILDVEFEDGTATKMLLKTGFIFSSKTEINLREKPVELKVKFYGYVIRTVPLKDKKDKLTGEYQIGIFKSAKSQKPVKEIIIHKDEYYVQHFKTPLGRI